MKFGSYLHPDERDLRLLQQMGIENDGYNRKKRHVLMKKTPNSSTQATQPLCGRNTCKTAITFILKYCLLAIEIFTQIPAVFNDWKIYI